MILKANEDGTYTITKPEACITVHVTFKKDEPEVQSHKINIGEMENGAVTATVNGEAVETAEENADVILTAAPNEGYRLEAGTLAVSYQIPGENATDEPKTEQVVPTPVEGKEGVYTFKMPAADVTVTAKFEQTYKVEVAAALPHGDVKPDKARAAAGETVQLTVAPEEGYELEAIGVTYTDGNGQTQEVTVENNAFEMPAGAVIVTARFKAKAELHDVIVTVKNDQGGTATAPSQAAAGETVNLDIKPNPGWGVDKVTVNGKQLDSTGPVTQLGYQFVMPDEDAAVVVECVNGGSTEAEE